MTKSASSQEPQTPAEHPVTQDSGVQASPSTSSGGLARHSMIYFIGSIVSVLGGILMLPVYTHALTPAHYGLLETALRFVSVCLVVGFVGLRQAYVRFYFEHPGTEARRSLTSTVVITNFSVALVVMLPVLTLVALVGKRFGLPNITPGLGAVLAVWLAFEATYLLGLSCLQVTVRSTQYVIAQVLRLATLLGVNYVLLNRFHMELTGAITGNLFAAVVSGAIASMLMLRGAGIHFSVQTLKATLQFSLPYIPAALLAYVVQNADRYSVIYFDSIASLGLLSLASKIGEMALMVFVAPVESVWAPYAFRVHEDADGPAKIGALYTRYAAICVLLAVGVSVGGPLAVRILAGSQYEQAADLIPIVAMGWVFSILSMLSDIGILISKRTYMKPWIVAASAVIAVAFQLALTPHFGILGAAVGTTCTYIMIFVIVKIVADRYYRMAIHSNQFLIIALSAAAAYFPAHWISQQYPTALGSIAAMATSAVIYALAMHATRVITFADVVATLRLRQSMA